jgi:NADPH:quinone reductase-like Zn-dependent oxidoreductase
MKVWRIQSLGSDQLALGELPQPRQESREVMVKLHAVSLNYHDLLPAVEPVTVGQPGSRPGLCGLRALLFEAMKSGNQRESYAACGG